MNLSPAIFPTRPNTAMWSWTRLTRWLLAFVIANGVVYWWLFVRLNSLERQLVGTWEGSRDVGKDRTVKLLCELRADRTAVVEFISVLNQPGQPVHQRIRLKQPTWSVNDSYLNIQEPLNLRTRAQLLFFRTRAIILGRGRRGYLKKIHGLGAIREVQPNTFEMEEWHMERVNSHTAHD